MNGNVSNILAVYHAANKQEVRAGLTWYRTARREAIARTGKPAAVACGVVSALSPLTAWGRNLDLAGEFVRTGDCKSTAARKAVAAKILRGVEPMLAIKGPKTRAFWQNLYDPTNDHYVTIDTHAYHIWRGIRLGKDATPSITPKIYHRVALDYRRAAKMVGILPNQIQAITWLAWRRLHDSPGRRYD